jgi:hypothetical protein
LKNLSLTLMAVCALIDAYQGTETVSFFDASGARTEGPTHPTPLAGKRVSLP